MQLFGPASMISIMCGYNMLVAKIFVESMHLFQLELLFCQQSAFVCSYLKGC